MVVAHVIIVSAPVQRIGFWGFLDLSDLRVRIWGLFEQGIGDLDSGLTIRNSRLRQRLVLQSIRMRSKGPTIEFMI